MRALRSRTLITLGAATLACCVSGYGAVAQACVDVEFEKGAEMFARRQEILRQLSLTLQPLRDNDLRLFIQRKTLRATSYQPAFQVFTFDTSGRVIVASGLLQELASFRVEGDKIHISKTGAMIEYLRIFSRMDDEALLEIRYSDATKYLEVRAVH